LGRPIRTVDIVLRPIELEKLKWVHAALTGLCGIGLIIGVRWASYLWYVIVLTLVAQLVGLLLLILGFGPSVAVASDAKTGPRLFLLGGSSSERVGKWFAVLCASSALLVAAHWLATRLPDTEGIAQSHPTIKHLARGGDERPRCDKINHCGA
jgi:hypothetical protein